MNLKRLLSPYAILPIVSSLLISFGCAATPPASPTNQEKQFTNMWDEIYLRLKPEIETGNISVDRGRTSQTGQRTDGPANATSAGTAGQPGKGDRQKGPAGYGSSSAMDPAAGQDDTTGEYIRIRFTDRVLFDSGDDRIKPDGIDVLTRLGHILKDERGLAIVIQGHTDNVAIRERLRSRFPDNMTLSQARATNAAQVLHQSGVPPTTTRLAWFGEDRPISSNDTEEGRRKNRRVEIVILPQ